MTEIIHSKLKQIKSTKDLIKHKLIDPKEANIINKTSDYFTIKISEPMLNLIKNPHSRSNGIYQQFVPTESELNFTQQELADPIGDQKFSPVKGLVHRYPDRCLLKPVNVCPVYCRFCFRREKVGPNNKALTPQELEQCYQYIENNPKIWEVILTGGDPLIMKPKVLNKILTRLRTIEHIKVLRIHTRVPTVDPERINNNMITVLKAANPIYIVLHANHPNEFTPKAITAINNLADNGITLLSQSVLLRGINDNIDTLSKLMRCFIENRIKPYYLHHGDLAKGTKHFRTSIKDGQELMQQLRGRFSGICQPTYVLDIPGGYGKSPIGPQYCNHIDNNLYKIKDYNNNIHGYCDND